MSDVGQQAKSNGLFVKYIRLGDVEPAESNPKQHDIGQISASVSRYGFVETPVVDGRTGRLVAGHGRIDALAALKKGGGEPPSGIHADKDGEWLVPVLHGWESKDDADAKAYLVASNRITEVGGWDDEALAHLLASIARDGGPEALLGTGYDGDDVDKLINDIVKSVTGATDADDVPEVDSGDVKTGDLYRLGDHLLLCGDSTRESDVARVAAQDSVDLVWTDPPYGVDYESAAGKVHNDNSDGLAALLRGVFATCVRVMKPGAFIYVAHPAGANSLIFYDEVRSSGLAFKAGLVWVKDSLVLGHSDYHYQHEPIIYAMKPSQNGRRGRGGTGWYGDNSQVSVFSFPKPSRSSDHPTMKPVELVEAMLKNSSAPGHVVFEPFSGSGTTLMACEKLKRKCRAIELSPVYVNRTIARWESFTALKAQKVES